MFDYIVNQYGSDTKQQNQFVAPNEVNQRDNEVAVVEGIESDLKEDGEGSINPAAPSNKDDAQEDDAH